MWGFGICLNPNATYIYTNTYKHGINKKNLRKRHWNCYRKLNVQFSVVFLRKKDKTADAIWSMVIKHFDTLLKREKNNVYWLFNKYYGSEHSRLLAASISHHRYGQKPIRGPLYKWCFFIRIWRGWRILSWSWGSNRMRRRSMILVSLLIALPLLIFLRQENLSH